MTIISYFVKQDFLVRSLVFWHFSESMSGLTELYGDLDHRPQMVGRHLVSKSIIKFKHKRTHEKKIVLDFVSNI